MDDFIEEDEQDEEYGSSVDEDPIPAALDDLRASLGDNDRYTFRKPHAFLRQQFSTMPAASGRPILCCHAVKTPSSRAAASSPLRSAAAPATIAHAHPVWLHRRDVHLAGKFAEMACGLLHQFFGAPMDR